ncbi:YHS domain-containing protein [bacterium]|nr:MAG: YHS domain-containing protein [bacterium]
MKKSILLATVMALGAPVWAQGGDFDAAKASWKDVRLGVRELDEAVAKKKLANVHDIAFNLRDSVRELRDAPVEGEAKFDKLVSLIGQVDGFANALDSSGDKNDLRGTVASQRKVHVALDQIAALFPAGTLPKVGPVVATGPVSDPVCRMTVTPASAPGKAVYGGQTYYFCSKADAQAFQKAPAKYAALYEEIAFGKPKGYELRVHAAGKVTAGKTATLDFAVREKGKSALVKDFQVVHEMLLHLIITSDDLSYFSHEHPILGKDGRFRLQTRFPAGGRYLLFGDFTPAAGMNQVLRSELRVEGAAKPRQALVADKTLTKTVDGITVSVKPSRPLEAGRPVLLTYTLKKGGKPLSDMQPYLGASGHMMAINRNGRDIVHTHTVGAGGLVTSAMATPSGPSFTYDLELPVSGLTKIWAQFQRGGKVLTVPFTFDVKGKTSKIVAAPKTAAPANAQKVTLTLPRDYKANAISVQAGKPVALTFVLAEDAGCGNAVMVPAANWNKTLKVGERATVVYTPKQSGPLKFACSMNHFRGSLVVK